MCVSLVWARDSWSVVTFTMIWHGFLFFVLVYWQLQALQRAALLKRLGLLQYFAWALAARPEVVPRVVAWWSCWLAWFPVFLVARWYVTGPGPLAIDGKAFAIGGVILCVGDLMIPGIVTALGRAQVDAEDRLDAK